MIAGALTLLSYQLAGEIVARAFALPVPGPVVGMLLLLATLLLRGGVASTTARAARNLLGVLSLLFVPAGVGIVRYLPLLRSEGGALALILLLSTLLTLAVTGGVLALAGPGRSR